MISVPFPTHIKFSVLLYKAYYSGLPQSGFRAVPKFRKVTWPLYRTWVVIFISRPLQCNVRLLTWDVVCLSVCPLSSVKRVYCGQTVWWTRMPLGTEVGLGASDIVLDGDPGPPTQRGTAAFPNFFGPCLLWPNGCVISANSGSFRPHCVKVHVRYLISWWVLV